MYEVEVKVRADHATVRERLAELGSEHVARVRQIDTYYDAPHRDFAETDEALRVRRVTDLDGDRERPSDGSDEAPLDEVHLTYKGPLVEAESKTREEFETRVADGEATAGILDGLGFSPAVEIEKDREVYEFDGYRVALDRVSGLGDYVEVEREAREATVEPVREGALAVLRDLGLDPDEQIRTSYLGLLLEAEGDGDSHE